jgi:AraC-like DNA-binding protein
MVPLGALLAELGVKFATVLDRVGLSVGDIRPDAFIPFAKAIRILDEACAATGRKDIGLMLGLRQSLESLGPVGVVMRHADTLGEALSVFAALQNSNSTGAVVYLMQADRDVILGYGIYDGSAPISPQLYDLAMAVGCRLLTELTQGAVVPEEIHLSHSGSRDPTFYSRLGRFPVLTGQIQTGLLLPPASLAFPLPEANRELHKASLTRVKALMGDGSNDTAMQVRHVLRPLLLSGHGGMDAVAARLGIHARTLRRRLVAEGTTFDAIKDEVRFAAARELLLLSALGIDDIAATLDYGSGSAFVHAFRRWCGISPGQWRRARA